MSPWHIAMLLVYAAGIAVGQVMFRLAALRDAPGGVGGVWALAFNPWFLAAMVLYGALSVFWIWLLRRVPLGLAYPFVALSFVLTLAAALLPHGPCSFGDRRRVC